ncbi:MAB_1171c family putative transporter [Nocardia fluminea]|uniref:MAB_1171c family putative transporter n=1 Tax=Nocardia fluminea TaxID=134984 RepID=UPI003D0F5352
MISPTPSPIPGIVAWPVLFLLALVSIGRWWLLRERDVDRLLNRALTAALVGLLLRETWVQYLLVLALPIPDNDVIQIANQGVLAAIVLTVAGIYGLAQLWSGADPQGTWRRQRVYDAGALLSGAIILIAGTPARNAGQLIDQKMGWPAVVVWIAFYIPLAATAWLVGKTSIHELRHTDAATTWRERMVIAGVLGIALVVGVDSIANPTLTMVAVLGDRPALDPGMGFKTWTFFIDAVWGGTVVAIPLISALLIHTGWDRTGRYSRRLEPLWRDLTAAVPEIVLDPTHDRNGRTIPATRLYRMTVEIRDAVLNLQRYAADVPPELGDLDARAFAQHLATLIDAKAAGDAPYRSPSPGTSVQPRARDLAAELQLLLDLAKVWPPSTRHQTHHAVDTAFGRIGAPGQ